MSLVIECTSVHKRYLRGLLKQHPLQALADVSFSIRQGEAVGLVGPNRAGKTTLVKVLLSLCKPTSGQVRRFGKELADRSTLARVGYVHENQAFPRYLSASEVLHFYGALALLPVEGLSQRVEQLLKKVDLFDRCHEPISHFSKGMIQRLSLAQALLNEPELLLLDEPTEGLDLIGRQVLRDVVSEYHRSGRTLILISHQVEEIEALCQRMIVLVLGKVRFDGEVQTLRGQHASLSEAMTRLYTACEDALAAPVRVAMDEMAPQHCS